MTRKSQAASEYAYRKLLGLPKPSIFWIHAGTKARFKEGYEIFASVCNIPGRESKDADLMQLVKD